MQIRRRRFPKILQSNSKARELLRFPILPQKQRERFFRSFFLISVCQNHAQTLSVSHRINAVNTSSGEINAPPSPAGEGTRFARNLYTAYLFTVGATIGRPHRAQANFIPPSLREVSPNGDGRSFAHSKNSPSHLSVTAPSPRGLKMCTHLYIALPTREV